MSRVLVPVEILEGEAVSSGLIELLGTVDVTILGYHVLPEQTPADQARHQFEEQATDALESLEAEFRGAGGSADYRLVFTHDEERTIDRIADEVNAQAYAIPGVAGDVEKLLVSLSGKVDTDRIIKFVRDLVGERPIEVTLFVASRRPDANEERLREVESHLLDAGVTVETVLEESHSPVLALFEVVPGHDAIVMGEKALSLRSLVFGDETERVASESVGPVLVVRGRSDSEV